MKFRYHWALVTIAFIVLFACTSGNPAQIGGPGGSIYFNETGYSVSGPFLAMFQSADDPLLVFGFPISDVLDNPIEPNVKFQYFQRARMDYDPDRPEGEQIVLAILGKYYYNEADTGEDANIYTNNDACRYFPETQYPVCYLFRQFYDAHNGEKFFGLPISDVRQIDGRLVQYFEKVRMEWRPYDLPGRRVKLTDLGQWDFDIRIGQPTEKPKPPIINTSLIEANIRAFPAKPLIGSNQSQFIYFVVQNQLMEPVPNAQITLRVLYPDGTRVNGSKLLITNSDGFVRSNDISTAGVKPNQVVKVEAEVRITSEDQPILITTWFRVWW